jgi:hypothetical protein
MTNTYDPNSGLPALTTARPRQQIPPGEAFATLDPVLADLLARSHQARHDGVRAAFEWDISRRGVTARQEDADYVRAALDEHGVMPDDDLGPLPDWPAHVHQLYVASWRSEIYADWLAEQARRRATSNRDVVDQLDRETDQLRDQMTAALTKARDDRNHAAYDAAMNDIAPRWLALRRLWAWVTNPTTAYQPPAQRTFPGELELLEYEAATALGQKRIGVPIEALQRPGAPPSDMFPTTGRGRAFPMDGTSHTVDGTTVITAEPGRR